MPYAAKKQLAMLSIIDIKSNILNTRIPLISREWNMSSEELNAWVLLVTAPITYFVYIAILLGSKGDALLFELAYQHLLVGAFGSAIGISLLTSFIVARVFSEAKHRDVRDDEIERASGSISVVPVVLGGLTVLGLAMGEVHHFWIANIMYFSFILAAVFRSITKIIAYRRGFGSW